MKLSSCLIRIKENAGTINKKARSFNWQHEKLIFYVRLFYIQCQGNVNSCMEKYGKSIIDGLTSSDLS